jgi:hypothetical protein
MAVRKIKILFCALMLKNQHSVSKQRAIPRNSKSSKALGE